MTPNTGTRTVTKNHLAVLLMTFILALGLWGSGLWALGQPDWNGGSDRVTYVKALRSFFAQENLYIAPVQPLPEDLNFFNYSPLAIFSVGVLSLLPPVALFALHLMAVIGLYLAWKEIFKRNNIPVPAWILPLWFAFSPFVYDAVTLNVNTFLALLATLYLWFVLKDDRSARLGAILTLFLIVTVKPQWGFFVFLPLVHRKWKDFLQVVAGLVILVLLTFALASLLTRPAYVVDQFVLYAKHLATFAGRFTYWNLPPGPYEYNNSIYQVFIYLLGDVNAGIRFARVIQAVVFAALALAFLTTVFGQRGESNPAEQARTTLRWFFIFYCTTLLYPPLNFDFSLGIPMFLFLAAQSRAQKFVLGIPLVIIAFQDIIRVITGTLGIASWFPFIFTATILALIFLVADPFRPASRTTEAVQV